MRHYSLALGVFGGFRRDGAWVVPPRFTAWSMWGGGRLDLTEARFTAPETVIRAVALWGGIGIVVPDDIDLQVRGFGLFGVFGGREGRARRGTAGAAAPRVVVKGLALFGAVVTKSPRK
ncbi:LiaF domain-containing protein [Streptomyces sp. WELS2]|uniref:LiaF domain-containing protein n=1 Tax=Streptomyces sp. WELS2 TaxID=2749435 RepID=UPI0015F026F4|nr:LiaF domain-containing protein [Streptomyces sp. WELS2]